MSGNKSNAPGFLNKFFNKNKSQSGSDNRGDTNLENKPNSQLFFQLLELYDTYSNNYTYFKSICLEEEGSKDKPVMHGVQGLKSLITELRFELQKLNNKYPYLVVVKDPDNLTNDKIKVYNSLYGIVKQSEGVLQHVKEQESSEFPLSDKPKDNSPSLSRRKSNSNLLGKGANSAVNQNKMFNKRGMRTMRDYSSEYRANSSLKISDTGESKIPTYIEQKKLEQQREEQKAQKLSAVQNKSYSNTSRGSITSGKHKKQTSSKAKSTDVDDGQLVDLTDNASKMDLVDDIETNDPFEDFDAEFAQPKVKKPAKITTPPARRSFEAKPMNPSLQAATLAAVNKGLKQTQSGPVPTSHQQRPKPAVKTATTSKKIPILENSGQAATKNASTNDSSKKTDKDLLEDEILKQTPEIDYKVGKQIFQEILVARSNQRPLEWDDIIGLDNCKSQLKETIVFPFLRPDLFSGLREPINGLLLYGPPGTGKTMLAKCVAYQTDSTFFNVSVSSITSKFLGESEKLVRSVFTLAAKLSPSIIFIDEIDSLLGSRGGGDDDGGDDGGAAGESSRRFKNEFLTQWSNINYTMKEDGTYNRVLVLGCTNLPWVIDDAARRRFQKRIYCPLPNEADRIKLIEMLMSKNEIRKDEGNIEKNFTHEEMAELSKLTDGFSNSDLLTLCKDASMEPIRELIRRGDNSILNVDKNTIRNITVDDFKRSLVDNKVKGSVNLETLRNYDKWTDQFGS